MSASHTILQMTIDVCVSEAENESDMTFVMKKSTTVKIGSAFHDVVGQRVHGSGPSSHDNSDL